MLPSKSSTLTPSELPQRGLMLARQLRHELIQQGVTRGTPLAQSALAATSPGATSGGSKEQDLIVTLGVPVEHDGSIGPALQARIDRTVEAAHRSPEARIVVTGGAVQNRFSEAQAMAQGLMAQGIAPSRVIVEPWARTTLENSAFVWLLVAAGHAPSGGRLTLVAEPYHMMRSLRIFSLLNDLKPLFEDIKAAPSARIDPAKDKFSSDLSRLIEEKRRVAAGW